MRSVLVWLPLVGCIEYDVSLGDGLDVYVQEPAEEVDILLIVDNSGSMAPYQEQLGDNFHAFISFFVGANVDYRIGITTTDPVADEGEFVGPVITDSTDDPAQEFNDQVNVGTTGTGYEMGLESGLLAVTDAVDSSDYNDGFLRDDATLSIIFVSDEEDSSPQPVNDYINEFFDIKGQRSRDVFNASALTVTDEGSCTAQQAEFSSPGTRYVDVARQTRGLIGNLCDDDFEDIVTELSLNVSQLTRIFELSAEPDPATITVTVNDDDGGDEDEVTGDREIPCDAGEWTYELVDGRPAVVFDLEHMPGPSSKIAIRYMFGSGDPAAFCGGGGEE